jgi:threonine/homoserine/homoserine lactone efflux protein
MDIVIPGAANLGLFVVAALVLLVVPGPAVLYIVARSVAQGRTAGFVSDVGIHSATLIHVAAAALGLSALLASSAIAFSIVKYAGAAYLIWLGLKKIFSRAEDVDIEIGMKSRSYARLYRDGFIVNLLNPKTALFFLAFLPQFVDAAAPHKALAFLVLGLTFICNGTIWCLGVAGFSAKTASRFRRSGRIMRWINRALGGMFVFLGARLALLQAS